MHDHTLLELLTRSKATEAFKEDVRAFLAHEPAERVTAARPSPRVKVARLLTKLVHDEPELQLERVHLDARSGCSDFRGVLTATTADERTLAFHFVWDCHWRAEQEGWVDAFGLPDQIRAAREFGWQCFESWSVREVEAARVSGP
jgi:hypothetical protein